jgi:hypothetical protein
VKHQNQHKHGKLQPIPAPDGPWQWIQSDFVGELPKSDRFNAIYIISDRLTKMAHFILTMMDIYKDLGIEPRFLMAYHLQTQGQVENNNKWMETYLQMFCSHQQDSWADLLLTVEFAYNNHHHPSIDMTPFFANYGYHPTLTNMLTAAQSGEPDE